MKSLKKFALQALALTLLTTAFAGGARSVTVFPMLKNQPGGYAEHSGRTVRTVNSQPAWRLGYMSDSTSRIDSRVSTVQGMTRVIAQLVKDHTRGSTERLRSGKAIDFTAMIDTDRSVAAWHTVNLKASYDARPIGGILYIRIGLAPVFGGIGSAVRSVNYREFAEAIDDFDDDFVAETISRLTTELGDEYTKGH
jgi:hypothetical protein